MWSSLLLHLYDVFLRFKDLVDGRVEHNNTQIAERQNFLLLVGPKEVRLSDKVT